MNYVTPRQVSTTDDCFFYHTIDVPGHGRVEGLCDMTSTLGHTIDPVSWEGKRVLEVGPANGFYTFAMEKMGADVVSVELGPDDSWDVVPHPEVDIDNFIREFQDHIDQLQNGFWFCHAANRSKARVIETPVYDLPGELGEFHVGTIHHVLLHLRDPFRAIQKVAGMTRETLVISEIEPYGESRLKAPLRWIMRKLRMMEYIPRFEDRTNRHTWWHISPLMLEDMCKLAGFTRTEILYHQVHLQENSQVPGYTIIAHRE